MTKKFNGFKDFEKKLNNAAEEASGIGTKPKDNAIITDLGKV